MSKSIKNIPERRFPEFKEEWKEEPFNKVYTLKVTNSFSRDKLNYENGTVKNIHYGDIHTKFSTLFDIEKENVPYINPSISLEKIKLDNYCVESDMIFADASEDLDGVGQSIEIVNLNNEKLLSGLHTLQARQKEKKLITGFGGYLFQSPSIKERIKKESQGAKVLGISGGRLSNIDIYYPQDEDEQKKIADCLTSIDNLILSSSKKVEALKEHKKGLMQQLFPKEGESVPNKRFPEFVDNGDWLEKTLDDVVNYENGKAHENDILESGQYIVVNSKFISTQGDVKKFTNKAFCLANIDDILMVLSDVPNGRAIAKCFFVDSDNLYTVNQRICRLSSKKGYVSQFLFYIINRNKYFLSFDDGIKQTNLRKIDVLDCPLLLPPTKEEQEKISNFIFSIDKLIDNQTKKVEALKEHKKGLMQQLFPNNEVDK